MIDARVVLAVAFMALGFSLHSLRFCFNDNLLPRREHTDERCVEDDERYESKPALTSAGFLSPSTLHVIKIEDANGDENCWAACSLGLQHNCSEPVRRECPTVACKPAKPAVAFEDLAEGEYIISVNCGDSRTSCYADPQEFAFRVQQQVSTTGVSVREIPLAVVKLYKKTVGRCSNDKVWSSRIKCFAVLEILMGVVFLLISLRERIEPHEVMPPSVKVDSKWVLQAKPRS